MILPLILFGVAFVFLFAGVPVAFAFGGAAFLVAWLAPEIGIDIFALLPARIYGIMSNSTLMAMPLFIFMGLLLEKSGIAERLLGNISQLFGSLRGGMALGVVFVGVLLAASTGVIGASVVMMGVIAIPSMLSARYAPSFASGVVTASGTLGQIIPPSIVLILLGDVLQISVGDLFAAALLPSAILVGLYVAYILALCFLRPSVAPAIESNANLRELALDTLKYSLPPVALIAVVLGGILAGLVTPSEASALGAAGAVLLSVLLRKFSLSLLRYAALQTAIFSGLIFAILIGASAFTLVFNETEGGDLIFELFESSEDKWTFILVAMLLVFVLGFLIDFIEICFIVVPLFLPLVAHFQIDALWFAILLALNLQTSFLTPPFGFALFYLKGAMGNALRTLEIYKGAVPFIVLQLLLLALLLLFPQIVVH